MLNRLVSKFVKSNARGFSSHAAKMSKLRIGYVPEHFSTPIAFAKKHYDLDAELRPFTKGTAELVAALKADDEDSGIDFAIGLTEGFVADLGKARAAAKESPYGLVGTYVESPLCWAISTGASRKDVQSVGDLKGTRCGVSRIGSGSYVMSYLLADEQHWLESSKKPFEHVVCGDINGLTEAVSAEDKADFFMWEHFTTKYLWDRGSLKKVGEIYTPWPSWMIAARETASGAREEVMKKLNRGIEHYRAHTEEAIEHITSTMHYSNQDAQEWMKTVRFADAVRGVDPSVVDETVSLLQKASVLKSNSGGSEHMIAVRR